MTMGIENVQTRIAHIRSLVAPLEPAASSETSGSASSASGFASALSDALGTGATGTSGLAALAGATSGAASGEAFVASAEKYLDVPYVRGSTDPSVGLDCSGLVVRALGDLGVTGLPRTAAGQMTAGTPVADLSQARPGDLLIFDGGSHVAIYLGDNRLVHASSASGKVVVGDVYETPTAIRRVLPTATDAAGALAGLTGSGSASDVLAALSSLTGGGRSGLSSDAVAGLLARYQALGSTS